MNDALSNENGAHIRALASMLPRLKPHFGHRADFARHLARFAAVREAYSLAIVKATGNCNDRRVCSTESTKVFRLTIAGCNIEDELLAITSGLVRVLAGADRDGALRDHHRTIAQLHARVQLSAFGESRGAKDSAEVPVERDTCDDCGTELNITSERSERYCPQCARVYPVYGIVFDESQLHQQEGQRGKSGCFNPSQHFDEWIRNILALESEELLCPKGCDETPADIVDALRAEAARRHKIVQMLGVEDVRALLKAVRRTELNAHTSLILKKLTGVGPPDISKSRRLKVASMFSRALAVRETLTENTGNRRYYPYYTIKIFDLVLPRGDPDRRLFNYIHLQSPDTLHKNDEEWKRICAVLGWEYRPTDPSDL